MVSTSYKDYRRQSRIFCETDKKGRAIVRATMATLQKVKTLTIRLCDFNILNRLPASNALFVILTIMTNSAG